jgi:hypothetical protein
MTRVSQGRLRDAEAIIDEDLDRVRSDSSDPGSMLSALLIGKAEILRVSRPVPATAINDAADRSTADFTMVG